MSYQRKILFFLLIISVSFSVRLYGQKANNLYERGMEEFKKNEFQKSIYTFTEVLSISPTFTEAYIFRGRSYHKLGKSDSAIADFNLALQKRPGFLPAHFYRAECYTDLKNYAMALPDLNKIIDEKPTFTAAYILRARCNEEQGLIDMAINDLTYLVNQGSNDSTVYFRRANLYVKKKMPKAAIIDLEKVVELAPRHANAWYLRATLLESRDKKPAAIENYTKVIDIDPNHEEARFQRARLEFDLKQYEKALEDYNYIVEKIKTTNINTYTMRGKCFGAVGRYKDAEKDFARVLERDPGNDLVFVEKAKMRMSRNDSVGSIPDLRKAIFFNEKNHEAYYLRGRIYYQTKKFKDAFADLDKSVKLQPTADALFFRALCFLESGDKNKACVDLVKADEMGSEDAKLLRKKLCGY